MNEAIQILDFTFNGKRFPLSLKNTSKDNYYTIIVGANATGKTRLMTSLINSYRNQKNGKIRKNIFENYEINYLLGSRELKVDGDSRLSINELPNRIISLSNSLYDKFPIELKSDDGFYQYIGVRSNNLTHAKQSVYELMDVLNENLEDPDFAFKASEIFGIIGTEPFIKIKLRPSYGFGSGRFVEFLENSVSGESLKIYFQKLINQKPRNYNLTALKRYIENEPFLNDLANYFHLKFEPLINNDSRELIDYEIRLDGTSSNIDFIRDFRFFSALRRLNILSYESIRLYKKGIGEYDIMQSSTGEIGLMITLLRLLPELEDGSVIFIDEPELSLHPNWQMRYVEMLRNLMSEVSGCHVVIATHSHFIVSDVSPKWSSILALSNVEGEIKGELIEGDTRSWSPENILYNVFGVVNTRNEYFENDMNQLAHLLSTDSDNKPMLKSYISKLNLYVIHPDDPLNILIEEAKKHLEKL